MHNTGKTMITSPCSIRTSFSLRTVGCPALTPLVASWHDVKCDKIYSEKVYLDSCVDIVNYVGI